jgi:hypothetical protein
MPDVCLSPPPPPAGPIPIPYPNFALAGDTTDGSRTVMAGGKEISLKGKSQYKKSTGDEAATRNFGGGILSHNITGPVKHKAGSFDVKVEGSQVVRNLDLTTGNHSNPGDGCTTVDTAGVAPGVSADPDCKELNSANNTRRESLGQEQQKTTVSHAAIRRPGATTATVWSCSSALGAAYRNGGQGYVSGLEREDVGVDAKDRRISDTKDESDAKGKQASNLCDKAKDQLRKNNGGKVYTTTKSTETPHTSHTEPRILESLFANGPPPAGTVVTLAIQVSKFNAEKNKWTTDNNPCPRCQRLICAAALCGITILICEKNSPTSVEDKTGTDCPE